MGGGGTMYTAVSWIASRQLINSLIIIPGLSQGVLAGGGGSNLAGSKVHN